MASSRPTSGSWKTRPNCVLREHLPAGLPWLFQGIRPELSLVRIMGRFRCRQLTAADLEARQLFQRVPCAPGQFGQDCLPVFQMRDGRFQLH